MFYFFINYNGQSITAGPFRSLDEIKKYVEIYLTNINWYASVINQITLDELTVNYQNYKKVLL